VATWLALLLTSTRSSLTPAEADTAKLQAILTFLDDCLKRSLKTPYKYLEESLEFDADAAVTPHHSEMPSPLFATLLEQLAAKIKAKLLQTDEIATVGDFIGGLTLALATKQRTLGHALEAARRLDVALIAAGLGKSSLPADLEALAAARIVAAAEAAAAAEQTTRASASLGVTQRAVKCWTDVAVTGCALALCRRE
jgi:hypothetical protein